MSDHSTRSPTGLPSTGSAPAAAASQSLAPQAFTFLNSFCTTILTTAIFFLTKNAYAFNQVQNLELAVLLGVTYIFGAKYAGRLSRMLRRRIPGASTRGVLTGVLVLLGLLCMAPLAIVRLSPETGSWPIWFVIGLYSPLTGVLWPIVESYVASGKRGRQLVRAVGTWNINWSAAGAIASIAVAPLVENHALVGMALLGVIHLGSAGCLVWFSANPAPHGDGSHEATPAHYPALLVTFRMLLPAAYVASSTLMPLLPNLTEKLHVAPILHTAIAAIYLATRSFTFVGFQRLQGWHGRWWPAVVCPGLLICGFGAAVFAGRLGGPVGWTALTLGLILFGVGMAGIYSGALYYAMEVGNAEVDAGGAHETLIGVGYSVGPALGLGVSLSIRGGHLAPTSFEPLVLSCVAGAVFAIGVMVALRVRRLSRAG